MVFVYNQISTRNNDFSTWCSKVLGLFGGYGFEATIGSFQSMGMPLILAIMVVLAEFAGAIGVILGFGTRFMAFSSLSL